jgi:bifunctional UDP-N-acetylglucosamine pyrophosphorylase/glucosamine-1-phosphate N-acetyltransferase
VVLAAGKGKRMMSSRPKVLHDVCGRPSLWHVVQAARGARPASLCIVVNHGGEEIEAAVAGWGLTPAPRFVDQGEPLGTGHAVLVAEPMLGPADDVVVLAGDDPLVTAEHVRDLLRVHRRSRAAATILTTTVSDPGGYGRVIRDGTELIRIVEHADASPAERRIREISTLVYAFRREDLATALPLVGRDNRQREYYLPDVLTILRDKGERISAMPVDFGGPLGLNTRRGLSGATRVLRRRIVERHMANGVTFVDPDTAYVDVDVRIGQDAVIQPFTVIQGATRIGRRAVVGPGSRVVDSSVGDDAEVAFSVVRGSRIGPRAVVGPYASLRPGTVLDEDAKAGSFVEIKASRVGRRSKVPHLSYVGDTVIGRDTNVGAATVTVNYDGYRKHRTVIGDEVHIGSDTMLVAPVRIGRRAWTGAGSVITRDVPAGALAVERAEQRVVRGYDERKRAARGEAGRGTKARKPAARSKEPATTAKAKARKGRAGG